MFPSNTPPECLCHAYTLLALASHMLVSCNAKLRMLECATYVEKTIYN
jgi:hypothetical protein